MTNKPVNLVNNCIFLSTSVVGLFMSGPKEEAVFYGPKNSNAAGFETPAVTIHIESIKLSI